MTMDNIRLLWGSTTRTCMEMENTFHEHSSARLTWWIYDVNKKDKYYLYSSVLYNITFFFYKFVVFFFFFVCALFVKKIDEYLHMVIHMIVSTDCAYKCLTCLINVENE